MKKKHIIPIIIIFIFSIIAPFGFFLGFRGVTGLWRIFPGDQGTQILLFIWSIIISSIIGVLLGYICSSIYLFIHRKIIGRGMTYYIDDRTKFEELNRSKFYGIMKALFPALLSLNIAFVLAQNPMIQEFMIMENPNQDVSESAELIAVANEVITLFLISGIIMAIPMALFSGCWILLDAGIVFTNKDKVENSFEPVEVKAVGNTFLSLFTGYTGIGFVVTLYLFISEAIIVTEGQAHFSFYGGMIFLPLILVIWAVPAMFIVDITWNHRKKFILKRARKIGATEITNIEIKSSSV